MLDSRRPILPALRSFETIRNRGSFFTRACSDPFFYVNKGQKRLSPVIPSSKDYNTSKTIRKIFSFSSLKHKYSIKPKQRQGCELSKNTPRFRLVSTIKSEAINLCKRPLVKVEKTMPLQYGGGTFRLIN